jgi:hypothetical protein
MRGPACPPDWESNDLLEGIAHHFAQAEWWNQDHLLALVSFNDSLQAAEN